MTCELVRESVSAHLDGEAPPLAQDVVAAHLAACGACAEWAADAEALHRRARLAPAVDGPDLTERVLAAAGGELREARRRRRGRTALAAGLTAVALAQLGLAAPVLLLGQDHHAPLHVAHEVGSFDAALAVGFLLAALRPRLAAGMLPLVGAVAALLVLTAGWDLTRGRIDAADELPHLLDVVGFVLLLWLSRMAARTPDGPPALLLPLAGGAQTRRRPGLALRSALGRAPALGRPVTALVLVVTLLVDVRPWR